VLHLAAFAVLMIAFVVAAASLVGRFRRARGIERQQLRWVALATVVVALLGVVHLVAMALGAYALAPLVGVSARRSCRRPSARRSCATGCTTWTGSSAAPWPTGC